MFVAWYQILQVFQKKQKNHNERERKQKTTNNKENTATGFNANDNEEEIFNLKEVWANIIETISNTVLKEAIKCLNE